jgi:hypothetical protein
VFLGVLVVVFGAIALLLPSSSTGDVSCSVGFAGRACDAPVPARCPSRPSPQAECPVTPPRAALEKAQALLARAIVPPGAAPVTATPFGGPSVPAVESIVTLHRSWSVPLPSATTQAFLTGHLPQGMTLWGSGSSGGAIPGGPHEDLYESFDAPDPGIDSAELLWAVRQRGVAASAIDAYAVVVWLDVPTKAQGGPMCQMPDSVTTLSVTRTELLPQYPVVFDFPPRVVTHDAAGIARLARTTCDLSTFPVGWGSSCGSRALTYDLAFMAGSRAVQTVTFAPACPALIGGAGPDRRPSPAFSRQLASVLNLPGPRENCDPFLGRTRPPPTDCGSAIQ